MTKAFKYIVATALMLALVYQVKGQDVNVTSAFDSSRIYIGDQIRFTITIDQPKGLKLILPAFRDTLVKNVEILSGPVLDSATTGGRTRIIEKYLVTSFDSGRYQVPPVYAELKSDAGLKRFYSDYALLEVMRVKITPPDTADKIFDIIGPYRAPLTAGEVFPWIIAAAALFALVWYGRKYLRKLLRPGAESQVVVSLDPAHVIAMRELERLREEKLWQKGEVKLYYTKLTEILRQYLENRFGVFSLELTTGETLEALIRTGFKKDENYKRLKEVLTNADLVKFAKYSPEPAEHEEMYQESWNFVMSTLEEPVNNDRSESNEKGEEGGI
jgi:hypothetical protein